MCRSSCSTGVGRHSRSSTTPRSMALPIRRTPARLRFPCHNLRVRTRMRTCSGMSTIQRGTIIRLSPRCCCSLFRAIESSIAILSLQVAEKSHVFEEEVLAGAKRADDPPEEMPERHHHGKNIIGAIRIQLCAKSFILQVYDVLARHRAEKIGMRFELPKRSIGF